MPKILKPPRIFKLLRIRLVNWRGNKKKQKMAKEIIIGLSS